MKTNSTSWIRRLAIIVGTVFTASQAVAITPAFVVQAPGQAELKTQAPKPMTVALGCTRVGTRMVC